MITMTKASLTRVGASLLALSLAGTLTACDSGATQENTSGAASGDTTSGAITIAYIQKQGDQQYFVDQGDGAKAAADELGDVTIKMINVGDDANDAISQMEAVIAQGVDGIIIVVPDQQIGPQVIAMAKEAGIPLMASDDSIEDADGNPAPFTGFDGTSMGNEVGKAAAELYNEAGWTADNTVILSAYKEDLSVCVDRVGGAEASFAEVAADVPETIVVGTDNSSTDAQDKAGAIITANAGVTNWVVWGCNDESETGVVNALQNAGVSADNIIGVGLGAYLTCKDWAAGQETGNKAALFISGKEVGKAAVTAVVDNIRNGVPLPPFSIADTAIVNADTWEAAGVVCN